MGVGIGRVEDGEAGEREGKHSCLYEGRHGCGGSVGQGVRRGETPKPWAPRHFALEPGAGKYLTSPYQFPIVAPCFWKKRWEDGFGEPRLTLGHHWRCGWSQ
jgi:hypothetical protein